MSPERWRQVEEVLQAALDCAAQERANFLEARCAGDDELKREAETFIKAYTDAGDFLEQPAIAKDAGVLFALYPNLEIGRVIGRYKLVACIGAGGMSEVYLAQDTQLQRQVALKILPAHFVTDDVRLRLFQREARAASALNHPNILTIHEVGEAEDVRFIATEYVDGLTLRELLVQANLSLPEIIDITIQITSALATAHAAGIVHRDIKLENIMRRLDGIVKILDFGIAKLTEQMPDIANFEDGNAKLNRQNFITATAQTETGIIIGTIGYMSPEQARGLSVDARTDIWSVGVVLYEMLACRAPFQCATRQDTLAAILENEVPPVDLSLTDAPAAVREALQRVIFRALRKDRNERYESAAEMLTELKAIKQECEMATLNASDVQTSANSQRRTRVSHLNLALIIASSLIAVMLGTFAYQHFNSSLAAKISTAKLPAASLQTTTNKIYRQMSDAEKLLFINEQEQRISKLLGDRQVELKEDALRAIKNDVDRYAARTHSTSKEYGEEDLQSVYARALPYLPLINRAFAEHKVPTIIGIYLPMIESEYKPCFENSVGAKGMFQFMPKTAKHYGVAHDEMCDAEKMTPAAARYIADRMAELGDDSESMTLVLLSYNRGPEWVRQTLRNLRTMDNYERNFWTLFDNRQQLDDIFRTENAGYVPLFFAAAIIGENPRVFELQTPPLTTVKP